MTDGRQRAPRRLALAAGLLLAAAPAGGERLVAEGEAFALGEMALHTPHARRDLAPADGPGEAFRFDGNSNWLESTSVLTLDPAAGLSAGAWLALASPPGDTAALVYLGEDGLLLGLNRWRLPEIRLGALRAAAAEPLPVSDWVHVAGDYDGQTLRLRVDGKVVAEARGEVAGPIEGLFAIGRALDAGFQEDTHPLGAVNGILGEVTFRRTAEPVEPGAPPTIAPPLSAPDQWYADDPDRPTLLPLGSTGWTNEPHALTWRDGLWHLHYQANPNGAYWRHIVWGHQVSRDLVTWERRHPALMPGTGFDRRGIWVGNWIPGRQPPSVLYTGVNGQWAGIGLAEADADGALRLARVVAHDTPSEYQDMRDPWVLRTDDGWLMLIGAGTRDRTEAFVYSYRSQDGERWEPSGRFDTGGARMPGQYWELPMLLPIGDRWALFGTPVVATVPARTLYWLGDFDGTRFMPDDPEPRQLDILATYRAPTLARGPEGDLVAIGIVADEIRGERERHEAGWVHVLTPATRIDRCADDSAALCQDFAPALAAAFDEPLAEAQDTTEARLEAGGAPVMLRVDVATPAGGIVRLGVKAPPGGPPAAELTVDAGTGVVRLDYTGGPTLPLHRSAIVEGSIPPAERISIELLIDGAAVFGAINGRPVGFLAFAGTPDRDELQVEAEGGAVVERLDLRRRAP